MGGEQNKALIRRFIEEFWNERRLELAGELFAPECVTHQLRSGAPTVGVPRGPEEMKEHAAGWLEGFPDLRFTVEQTIAEGDCVVSWCRIEGTHTGPWFGVPPTGRTVSIRSVAMHRVRDGRIVEDWVLVGTLGLLQQLGMLPPTEELFARAVDAVPATFAGAPPRFDTLS